MKITRISSKVLEKGSGTIALFMLSVVLAFLAIGNLHSVGPGICSTTANISSSNSTAGISVSISSLSLTASGYGFSSSNINGSTVNFATCSGNQAINFGGIPKSAFTTTGSFSYQLVNQAWNGYYLNTIPVDIYIEQGNGAIFHVFCLSGVCHNGIASTTTSTITTSTTTTVSAYPITTSVTTAGKSPPAYPSTLAQILNPIISELNSLLSGFGISIGYFT